MPENKHAGKNGVFFLYAYRRNDQTINSESQLIPISPTMKTFWKALLSITIVFGACMPAIADDHDHGATTKSKVKPPTVYLDKSPRIVEYQLKRLENERLLLVPRKTDDPKYIPVYQAILTRGGMSPQYREESVDALSVLNKTTESQVLLSAVESVKVENRESRRTARTLAEMLLKQPVGELTKLTETLEATIDSAAPFQRGVAFAALIAGNQADKASELAFQSDELTVDWAHAIPMLRQPEQRNQQREKLVGLITQSKNVDVKTAAIAALGAVKSSSDETFQFLAPLIKNDKLRDSSVKTLLRLPLESYDTEKSNSMAAYLVEMAEMTEPANRTTDEFVDAMQLVDRLMAKLPTDTAKAFRKRLSEVTVRVVKIKTVEEEMRYDVPYFAVEAGRPVQIVLENHDLMPHNLVVTQPGKLKDVANEGLAAGPTGTDGLPYVPDTDDVIAASEMIQPDKVTRITLDAPTEPGEYSYVCTFPQHWYRMYGVMVVVEDLDEWNKNPTEPANPIGSNRAFIQAWTVDDLKSELSAGIRGSTPKIGEKIFKEASCAGCHKVAGNGGVIGPELTDVWPRMKGDEAVILREILDPSHKIEAKYAMHLILTVDGETISGIVIKEDDDNVSMLTNPESQKPTLIAQDDIEEMVKSSTSMMPKALMDQYSKAEIFELMGYLKSVAP